MSKNSKQEEMDLEVFIKNALLSISGGVKNANDIQNRFRLIGTKRDIAHGSPDGAFIEFDVLVNIGKQSTTGNNSGSIGVLNVFSGKLTSGSSKSIDQTDMNRLKFTVWISENDLTGTGS